MATTIHARKGTAGKTAKQPDTLRKGIFWDKHAGQFACRIGYKLDEHGQRVRDTVHRLGTTENEAVIGHAQRAQKWQQTVDDWPSYADTIRPGLPEAIREIADLSKPVWVRPEWGTTAGDAKADLFVGKVVGDAAEHVHRIATSKALLSRMAHGTLDWLSVVPQDIRAQVLQAIAPSANEVNGLAPDARRLTIRQAADEYLKYKAGKVGLKLVGRRSGGGINGATHNHLAYNIDGALLLLDESADLRTLTHERLEKFIDDAFRKAKSPRTAFNWCRGGLKPMLDWCHKRSDIDYRNIETIDEIFRLRKPETTTKTSYTPETAAKLLAIKAAEDTMQAESWVFILLGLNTGAYQCDIASWTYDNLKFTADGKPYLWWQRQKEMHHNADLWNRHDIWPEVWTRMQTCMAPDDPKKNPLRRLFLTRDGKTLYETGMGKSKRDVIRMRHLRVIEKAFIKLPDGTKQRVELSFKQLRKIGLNAVKKYSGGSDDIARKYAGQKVPGVLKAYLEDEFDEVAAALIKWREQLVADKVL